MSKAFGNWIKGEMDRLGYTSKDVVGKLYDAFITKDSWDTVKTRLSKLRGGDPEGFRYFFDEDRRDRLAALAELIHVTPDDLMRARERFCGMRTLVLDPRLDADVVAFLVERSAVSDAGFACHQPAPADDVRRALRDAADSVDNPVVVVSQKADIEVFELAKLDCTQVERVPRGVRLVRYPDLVPIPPPLPPRLFDVDGAPLIPIEDPWRPQYWGSADSVYQRVVRPADQREEIPCLCLADAVAWFTRDGGPFGRGDKVRYVPAPTLTPNELVSDDYSETQIWSEGGQIFIAGPRFEDAQAAFRPHHDAHRPPAARAWFDLTKDANPWTLGDEAAAVDHPLHTLRDAIPRWSHGAARKLEAELWAPWAAPGTHAIAPEPREARARLRELCSRPFAPNAATVAFVLQRVTRAPWVVYANSDARLDLVADMGAGNLLELRLKRLVGRPGPCRAVEDPHSHRPHTFELGDYVLGIATSVCQALEGPLLSGRERRRAEAARADDNDDD